MVTRTEDLDSLLARIPDPAIRSLFSREFILCAEHFDRFTIDSVLRLVHALDLGPDLSGGASTRQILERHAYAPRAAIPVSWFLRKLADAGYLSASGGGSAEARDILYTARGPLPPGDPDVPEAQARALDPGSAPAFAVVRAMVEHVPEFLRGERTGEEILFAPTRLPLWFDYFSNDNLLYQINNRLGAEAVARALPATRPATILEIGGGSGSAALAVGERLARDAALSRVALYRFTEVVPTFLRRAERSLRARFPEWSLEFARLDMDQDFVAQGVPEGIADVVYAVNTVHIARNLQATLGRIRAALRPGGVAVFSECVRPFPEQPIYVEFVFNFLENFTGVVTDARTRPNHGFLTPGNWRDAFRAAGFERPEILPDVEELARHYDAFFVAAVSARRPA
ncbi:MAG TPA: class I SAM-dependent methyltransferase [Thermoanaerobaculia bacterium]